MYQSDLINNPQYTVRTARSRGYVSRKSTPETRKATPYAGKYGNGYTVLSPAYDSKSVMFANTFGQNCTLTKNT